MKTLAFAEESQANAGIRCVTNDIPLRERQEEHASGNEKMFAYVSQNIRAILECHSERSEESLIISGSIAADESEMFRFAQHDSAV